MKPPARTRHPIASWLLIFFRLFTQLIAMQPQRYRWRIRVSFQPPEKARAWVSGGLSMVRGIEPLKLESVQSGEVEMVCNVEYLASRRAHEQVLLSLEGVASRVEQNPGSGQVIPLRRRQSVYIRPASGGSSSSRHEKEAISGRRRRF